MKSKILKLYNPTQRYIIILFVIDIFAWLIAPFSKYYLSNMEVYLDVFCFLSVAFSGGEIKSRKNIKISQKYFVACLAIILIPVLFYGDLPFVSVATKLLFAASFVSLRSDIRWAIYQLFVSAFTILLFLGIIEWVLMLFGINFIWATVDRGQTQEFHQGILILVPTYYLTGSYRFMSLCEEPGVLGNICFFLLATLDYTKYKKQFVVLLVAGLISFSLGFYVLISLWVLAQNKHLKSTQIGLGIVAVAFMLTLFGGFFEERIIERITERESIETIDNRTNDEVNKKFLEVGSDYRLFVGMGNRTFYEWEKRVGGFSAGVKNFVLQYGILGLSILVIAFSALIIQIRGYSKQTLMLVAFVWICFYKSHTWNYPPLLLPLLTVPIAVEAVNKKKRQEFKQLKPVESAQL